MIKSISRTASFNLGLVLLALSAGFYGLGELFPSEDGLRFFMPGFVLLCTYRLHLVVKRKTIPENEKIHNMILFLLMFFISAWSLNKGMPIFAKPAGWFSIAMILAGINLLALCYRDRLSSLAIHLVSFFAAASLGLFLYLAIYLLPFSALGVIGFFLLGVSLHIFSPLLLFIYSIILLKRTIIERRYWKSFIAGAVTVLCIVCSYVGMWTSSRSRIDDAWEKSQASGSNLPAWTIVGQEIPANAWTKRILRVGLTYQEAPLSNGERLDLFAVSTRGEGKIHNPLVVVAAFFGGKTKLQRDQQVSLLRSIRSMGRMEEDRLWSGDDLVTGRVKTEVRVWSACNMSYTEKTITVDNTNQSKTSRPQEAIYAFYLSEGSVVTSLSLWINGKEEKGILTTKAKADSAYRSIVGVEVRDPSVVHWQEGNTVSVRVFPVMPADRRVFKIGVTSPLARHNGKLLYQNVQFDGPSFSNAKEDILFDFVQPVSGEELPATFSAKSAQSYKRSGRYQPRWGMQINDPGLNDCSFSFANKIYSLAPYHPALSSFTFHSAFLDINASWTRGEFEQVMAVLEGKRVYVYDSALIRIGKDNADELWSKLHKRQFSLFPLYEIADPATSVLISRSADDSPGLDQLEGTSFMTKTKSFLAASGKVKLFNIGTNLSPYLRSLKEFRVFLYDHGTVDQLSALVKNQHFPSDVETDDAVIIHESDMIIQQRQGTVSSTGPDHVYRLFTYNHIMQKLGTGTLTGRSPDSSLVAEAAKAYVVSPVSSLVVLETQADYDRFGISDSGSSLKNAALASKGAVPEPHEWALIVLSIFVIAVVIKRKRLQIARHDPTA